MNYQQIMHWCTEYGGAEADIKYAAIMWEEQSYSYCSGPGFSIHR